MGRTCQALNLNSKMNTDMKDLKFTRGKAVEVFELTKGFTPEQRDKLSLATLTAEEMAGYVLELEQQNGQLIEALKQAKEALECSRHYHGGDYLPENESQVYREYTIKRDQALKTINKLEI